MITNGRTFDELPDKLKKFISDNMDNEYFHCIRITKDRIDSVPVNLKIERVLSPLLKRGNIYREFIRVMTKSVYYSPSLGTLHQIQIDKNSFDLNLPEGFYYHGGLPQYQDIPRFVLSKDDEIMQTSKWIESDGENNGFIQEYHDCFPFYLYQIVKETCLSFAMQQNLRTTIETNIIWNLIYEPEIAKCVVKDLIKYLNDEWSRDIYLYNKLISVYYINANSGFNCGWHF
jgi:hypothetical protein